MRNSQYLYAETLREAQRQSGRWLDLGCGHDHLPSWMTASQRTLDLKEWTSVGVDMDAAAISRHAGLRLRVLGNIERLPFRDRTFQLITANMVLEHVQNPSLLFEDVARVLADDGLLIVHTPNVAGYTTVLARLIPQPLLVPLAGFLLGRAADDVFPTFYRANSIATLRTLAGHSNLTLASFRYVTSSPQLFRVPVLRAIERSFIRLLERHALARYRPCILATFAKSPIPGTTHNQ